MRKKGGRPKLSISDKRSESIRIWCTSEQKKQVKEMANSYGLTITDYVLKKSLGEKVVFNHREYLNEIHELGTELARQGNNLNQLAKYANILLIERKLRPDVAEKIEEALRTNSKKQEEVRIAFRTLIREMAK
ncbi:MAG: plasmid mobilization protein [Mangrovibacterium sp.]